ncbi:hypothetical protein MTR67_013561 [Solanum verrucosum]|uniref:RNase H type-1 domain-containing protein n=1 Tax=Solanum verrucosum TaxID=315347 RepID=A0AAF0QBF8_SOLVR|nr:hypothetical protein MTR67_013561 [Solanum verrucosum]
MEKIKKTKGEMNWACEKKKCRCPSKEPIPKLLVVCWQKPEQGLLKLNTDGSFNISNGKAGHGGALRDEEGELIKAFSVPIECFSHNETEAKAT